MAQNDAGKEREPGNEEKAGNSGTAGVKLSGMDEGGSTVDRTTANRTEKKAKLAIFLAFLVLALSLAIPFKNQILTAYIRTVVVIEQDSLRDILLSPVRSTATSVSFDALLMAASSSDFTISDRAQGILDAAAKHLGPVHLEKLRNYIKGASANTAEAAFRTYRSYSRETGDGSSALEWTSDSDELVRKAGVIVLGELAFPPGFNKALQILKTDPSADNRAAAADALARFGTKEAVDPLTDALGDKSPEVQRNAAISLTLLCAGNPLNGWTRIADEGIRTKPVPHLIRLLKDPDMHVRYCAVNALGSIRDRRAVEPLVELLSDPDDFVLCETVDALGEIGDRRALQPLLKKLKEGKKQAGGTNPGATGNSQAAGMNSGAAGKSQGVAGTGQPVAGGSQQSSGVNQPASGESQQSSGVNQPASGGSQQSSGTAQPAQRLSRQYSGAPQSAVYNIILALGSLGDASTALEVEPYLKDPQSHIRGAAIATLGQIGDARVLPALEKMMKDLKEEEELRREAEAAAGEIKKRCKR